MGTFVCPKGHASTEADFCSDCGAKIAGVAAPAVAAKASLGGCPSCGAARTAEGGNFCEICGWNFVTASAGGIPAINPAADASPVPAPPTPDPPPVVVPVAAPVQAWAISVAVDPSLRAADSPEVPQDFTPREINLDKPMSLIGRRSEARAVFPEVSLDYDSAVSHRHAILNLTVEGALTLRDIGSANGTMLNGIELKPMTDSPLKDGDQIVVGHFTRLVIKERT